MQINKTKKAIIFGTGSFAEVAYFYLTNDSEYEISAFTATKEYIKNNKTFLELPLVSFEKIEASFPPDKYEMFIAIGYANLNKIREKFYNEAKIKGYKLLTYISSKAAVWTRDIGDNCFIMENNTIQPFVKIGNNVVIWSGNHIGHHSIIEDHCFISSHVVICGHCRIKSYTFLGVNSTIRDSVTIEKENIIGANALILKDTKERQVYAAKMTKLHPKDSFQIKISKEK